jgi:hypothetical protein
VRMRVQEIGLQSQRSARQRHLHATAEGTKPQTCECVSVRLFPCQLRLARVCVPPLSPCCLCVDSICWQHGESAGWSGGGEAEAEAEAEADSTASLND